MGRGQRLTTTDVRRMLRLANELHDLPADAPRARHVHLLRGVCDLAAATHALLFTDRLHPDGTVTHRSPVLSVGWDTSHRPAAERYFHRPEPADPMVKPTVLAAVAKAEPVTHPRDAVLPDRDWYAHPAVDTVRRALGVDHCLYSVHTLPGAADRAGWVCLHRPWGERRRFGARERDVLHSLHVELAWVYDRAAVVPSHASPSAAHPAAATLTDRQRQTLDRLLAGRSEKQVAAEMGLSKHTVHVHVKSLYRTFHVNSRHELLAKFIRRGE